MVSKFIAVFLSFCLMVTPNRAKADLFGGDVAVLVQILAQSIKQLYELQQILQTGQDSLNLMRDINRGINESLRVVESLGPYIDPGVYKEIKKVEYLVRRLQGPYGRIVESPDKVPQEETDQVVAEAITLNTKLYEYAKELDLTGERIKAYSHEVSPGGAQKLTAQSLGVMLHVMNQQLRATATGLKLQAQALAVQNKKEKQATESYLSQADTLRNAMKKKEVKFEFPRF